MTFRHRLPVLLALLLACLALGACGTDVRSQTAEQNGAVGDLVITTKVCQTEIPLGCRAPSSVSVGKQLLIGFRVPVGVDAPATLTARIPQGYGSATVRLRRDDGYGAWIQSQPSGIDGETRSFGYVSDVLPIVATDDISVTAKLDTGVVSRFEYQTIVGYRTGNHLGGPDRPVDCTGEQQAVEKKSPERFTDCGSGGTSVGGGDALELRGLEVAGGNAAIKADPGETATVPFKLKMSGPELDRTVAVSATTTLPGATVKVLGGDVPFGPGERTRDVTVAVPADAAPGDYEVTLRARVGETERTATRTLTVAGKPGPKVKAKTASAVGSADQGLPVVDAPGAPTSAKVDNLFMSDDAGVAFGYVCTTACGEAQAALLVRFGAFGARAASAAPLRMLEIGETSLRTRRGKRVRSRVALYPKARLAVARGRALRGLLVVRTRGGKPQVRRVVLKQR